jgi:hypothetical protein
MGSIRKIGKNYQVDACRKGVRVRKIVGPSLRIAKEVLAELEGRLVHGEYGLGRKDASIGDVLDRFEKYAVTNMARVSASRYQNVLDRFKEFLSTRKSIRLASHLTPGVIEDFRQHRMSSDSPPRGKSMNFEIKAL